MMRNSNWFFLEFAANSYIAVTVKPHAKIGGYGNVLYEGANLRLLNVLLVWILRPPANLFSQICASLRQTRNQCVSVF